MSTGKYVHDKLKKFSSTPVDISFKPNHRHELTSRQEDDRIHKILKSIDYFGGYSWTSDGYTYNLHLKKPDAKDKVVDVLSKNGYKIISN
mgnify:FL=1